MRTEQLMPRDTANEAVLDRAAERGHSVPGTHHSSLITHHSVLRLARRKPLGAVSALILLAMLVAAVAAPLISPYDPLAQDSAAQAKAPSAAHVMGTDHLGRDVLSRVIYGARVSLWVGLVSVGLGLAAGTTL